MELAHNAEYTLSKVRLEYKVHPQHCREAECNLWSSQTKFIAVHSCEGSWEQRIAIIMVETKLRQGSQDGGFSLIL